MYKAFKKIITIFIILLIFIIFTTSEIGNHIGEVNTDNINKKEINVGFYSYYPMYFINEELKYDGYYHDIMEFISSELNLDYNYIELNLDEGFIKLDNKEIDLLFGVSLNPEKKDQVIYSKYHINTESMALYTNKKIKFGDLEALNGQRIGAVKYDYASELILNELNSKGIYFEFIEIASFEELEDGLGSGYLDAIVHLDNNDKLGEYNKVYNFSAGPVYIVASKDNLELINSINKLFEEYFDKGKDPFHEVRNKYYNRIESINEKIAIIFFILIALVFLFVIYISYRKYLMSNKMKAKIKMIASNLSNNKFFIVYQPIIDPKKNSVKGFEALLRLREGENIISPDIFLKDIEAVSKMDVVSLWIVNQVLLDYSIIKDYKCIKEDFYISINISYKELEDDRFIEMIKESFINATLNPNSICLEIIEKVAINDLLKVQKVINTLKKVGFMVAIDDFGVEYSNLDILEKIDCDIIKLDKFFIDEIENSTILREIVKFVSAICKITNKIVVCEGVENQTQKDIIKCIDNEKIYIQGYYYSKPLTLEVLKEFYINKL